MYILSIIWHYPTRFLCDKSCCRWNLGENCLHTHRPENGPQRDTFIWCGRGQEGSFWNYKWWRNTCLGRAKWVRQDVYIIKSYLIKNSYLIICFLWKTYSFNNIGADFILQYSQLYWSNRGTGDGWKIQRRTIRSKEHKMDILWDNLGEIRDIAVSYSGRCSIFSPLRPLILLHP